MITVVGIFQEFNLAEDASLYLLANDFLEENIDLHPVDEKDKVEDFFNQLFEDKAEAAAHFAAAHDGTIVTIHTLSIREAQEAVDVLNNYGALDVTIPGSQIALSRIVERAVNDSVRLRG
jgi:predicted SnoaL-like aldol condensation-catalyzing enzyme